MASFAVIIPTLDEEPNLIRCIDSLGGLDDLELIVADGGSRDRSRELAADLGATVISTTSGRGLQMARGAALSSASTLLFLHADCRLPEGWRDGVCAALDDPAVSLAVFWLHTDPSKPGAGRLAHLWFRLLDLRSRSKRLPYGDQVFSLRREVYEAVGGFPKQPLMEDLALARACAKQGRIARVPLEVRTTARRYEHHPVRTRLINLTFPTLYRLGVPAQRLADWYGVVR